MKRSNVIDAMGKLKLFGMRAAYDEVLTTAIKRQHEPQQIIGDLLTAEISEKQARSIKYQMTIAKLPLAKELPSHGLQCKPLPGIGDKRPRLYETRPRRGPCRAYVTGNIGIGLGRG